MENYRIVLADDHIIFRQGMKRLIDEEPGLKVVGEANDGSELFNRLHDLKPDLVILDISMPEIGGFGAAREIKSHHPNVKVLMLTMHIDYTGKSFFDILNRCRFSVHEAPAAP